MFSLKPCYFSWGAGGGGEVSLLVWVKLTLPFFWEVKIQDFSSLKFAIILNMQCSILTWNQLYSLKCSIFNCTFIFLMYAPALKSIQTRAILYYCHRFKSNVQLHQELKHIYNALLEIIFWNWESPYWYIR